MNEFEFSDFEKRSAKTVKEFVESGFRTYWEDSIYYSECEQDMKFKNDDMYLDYLIPKCKSIVMTKPFEFQGNYEVKSTTGIVQYEKDFMNAPVLEIQLPSHRKGEFMQQNVFYEKYDTRFFTVKHKELQLKLKLDFPFSYEIRNSKNRIIQRYVTVELLANDERCLNMYHFPRWQINRVIYLVNRFVCFDFNLLEIELMKVKTKYEGERKLIVMNRIACTQFIKKLASKQNVIYKLEDKGDYCNLQVQLPKQDFFCISITYLDFTEKKEYIKKIINDSKA